MALAVWLSDRWAWALPALMGVLVGVAIYRIRRMGRGQGANALSPMELGSLLILTGFLYIYEVFLMLQLGSSGTQPSLGLVAGLVMLSLLLLGFVAVFLFKARIPRWLARAWERLLQEH